MSNKINIKQIISEVIDGLVNEELGGEDIRRQQMALDLEKRFGSHKSRSDNKKAATQKADRKSSQKSFDLDSITEEEDEDTDDEIPPIEVGSKEVEKSDPGGKPDLPSFTKKELQSPTLDFLIKNLNTFRAGQSLKDPDVISNLELYFDGLTNAEKQALVSYVYGLSQVVVSNVSGRNAAAPKKVGVSVKSDQGKTEKASPKLDVEDDEPQEEIEGKSVGPIVVGESAEVRRLLGRSLF